MTQQQASTTTPTATRLRISQVPISRLRPWAGNPRGMAEGEREKLKRSIQQFGLVEPLVVQRSDGRVIGGHQRLEAAKALGLRTVPVVFVDLGEAEAKLLNLALNKIQGSWDLPKLGELLEELQALPDLDVTLSGFEPPEIEELLGQLERERAPQTREESFPQAAETLQEWWEQAPTRVSPGEVWQLGRHRLCCGDSLAPGGLTRLTQGQPVDLVVTDPPYGLDYQSTQAAPGRRKRRIANDEAAGFEGFLARALPAIKAEMKRGGVLYWFAAGGGPSTALAKATLAIASHFTLLNTLVWDRMDVGLGRRWRRRWEAIVEASLGRPRIWHGGTEQANVLRVPRLIPQAGDHPCPKPVGLLAELIRCAAPAHGRVLDPFAGSGSTLVAAELSGRTCLAGELEPRYADMIVARYEALTGEKALRLAEGGG